MIVYKEDILKAQRLARLWANTARLNRSDVLLCQRQAAKHYAEARKLAMFFFF